MRVSEYSTFCFPFTWFIEFYCRSGVTNVHGFKRLDARPSSFSLNSLLLGVTDRSVCQRMERAVVNLCVLDSTTTCADTQRLLSMLETQEVLCVSWVCPHSEISGEGTQGRGDFGPGMPLLAVPDLVSSSSRVGSGCSTGHQTSSESVVVERVGGSSAQQFANSVRVENIRMRF